MQFRKHRCLFLILIVPLFQSCSLLDEIGEASFDRSHHSYGGVSYSTSSPDKDEFGVNLTAMLWLGMLEGQYPGNKSKSVNQLLRNDYYVTAAGEDHKNYVGTSTITESASNFAFNADATNYMNNSQPISAAGYSENSPLISSSQSAFDYSLKEKIIKSGKTGFMSNVRVLTGLMYVLKNSKDGDAKIGSGYLQVPVYASYYHSLENDGAVFGGVGPYFAYGIGGKIKSGGVSLKTFDKDLGFKRFDAGLSVTAGYKLAMGLSFRIAYDFGLTDIDRNEVDYTKNRGVSFNVGYPIRKILKK